MKRDMDLVRKILIFFDEKEGPEVVQVPPIEGHETLEIKYHCVLMYQANLLTCEPAGRTDTGRVYDVWPFELTWDGHEFLESIRNDTIWSRIKSTISARGSALTFSIVNYLAKDYATRAVEAGIGP